MKIKKSIHLVIFIGLIYLCSSCSKDSNSSSQTSVNPIVFNPNLTYGSLTDIDGNVYKTIIIGSRTWMAENLRVTHYNNGNLINGWGTGMGNYYDYNNDASYSKVYGRLYNWGAVTDSRGIAPAGWRVANKYDFIDLINYLGGSEVAGDSLKESGLNHWLNTNPGILNKYGFTALPGGARYDHGANPLYFDMGNLGKWWTSTGVDNDSYSAIYMGLNSNDSKAILYKSDNTMFYSVRLIKN